MAKTSPFLIRLCVALLGLGPLALPAQVLMTGPQVGALWLPATDTTIGVRTFPGLGLGLRYLAGTFPVSAGISADFMGRRTGAFDRQQYFLFSAYGDYFLQEKGLRPYVGARLGGWLDYRTQGGVPRALWYLGVMPRLGVMPAASHNAYWDLWIGYGVGLPEAGQFQMVRAGLTLWYNPAW